MEIVETKDNDELARLNEIVQSWHHQNYPRDFKPYNHHEISRALEGFLMQKNSFALLAKSDEITVGYLLGFIEKRAESAFQYEKEFLNIDQICVVETHRKQGVGKLLLKAAIKLAEKKGVSEVQLNHWSGNKTASDFFMSQGFDNFKYKMKKY